MKNAIKVTPSIFLKNLLFFSKRSKGLKNVILHQMRNFYFSSHFDGIFLHLFPLNESFQYYISGFTLSFAVFKLKGVKLGDSISYNMKKQIFTVYLEYPAQFDRKYTNIMKIIIGNQLF